MKLEDRIRTTVESLGAEPEGLHDVKARVRARRRRTRRLASGVAAVVAITTLAGLAAGFDPSPRDAHVSSTSNPDGRDAAKSSAKEGDPELVAADQRRAPVTLAGSSADGAPLDVADLRGDVVVIRFWYSSCLPCREDVPVLADLVDRPGVRTLGVAVREPSRKTLQAAEDRFGMPFDSIWDPDGEATEELGDNAPQGFPTTWVLDREGRLAASTPGQLAPGQLDGAINSLLVEAGSSRELSAYGGQFCPATLPLADQETHGFGSSVAAVEAPQLVVPPEVWQCEYTAVDVAPPGSNGAWIEWTLRGTPSRLESDQVRVLSEAVASLEPPTADQLCNADLGSRFLFAYAVRGDLTGVVVDDFGCRNVQLTDDPFITFPGEATQPGVVGGFLEAPAERLTELLGH